MEKKLHFPNKTIDYNRKFEAFLREIDDHLNYVLKKLGWELIVAPQFTRGHGSVVIHLTTVDGNYIFRVPRYSQVQLRKIHLAYRLFGGESYMPKYFYHDEKCFIEEYVEGSLASSQMTLNQCDELGGNLRKIHANKGYGFGPLDYDKTSNNESFGEYNEKRISDQFKYLYENKILSNVEVSQLEIFFTDCIVKFSKCPVVICHGDLWPGNIIAGKSVKFIDWDNIAAYPREFDFIFLNELELSHMQKKHIFDAYGYEIDQSIVLWRTIYIIVKNCRKISTNRLNILHKHILSIASLS